MTQIPPQHVLGGHPINFGKRMRQAINQQGGPGTITTAHQWGVVVATHTLPNSVDVQLDGSSTTTAGVRYLAGYTPTVNDYVLIARLNLTDRVVLGKLA